MKFVTAIIKPFMLDDVRDALLQVGVQGLTISEVRGFGIQRGHTEIYRGAEYAAAFVPKLKIELAVPAEIAPRVVDAIANSARTGTIGDGKVFVAPLDHAVRIRTGESDGNAL